MEQDEKKQNYWAFVRTLMHATLRRKNRSGRAEEHDFHANLKDLIRKFGGDREELRRAIRNRKSAKNPPTEMQQAILSELGIKVYKEDWEKLQRLRFAADEIKLVRLRRELGDFEDKMKTWREDAAFDKGLYTS